jgi:hypothetical protein
LSAKTVSHSEMSSCLKRRSFRSSLKEEKGGNKREKAIET